LGLIEEIEEIATNNPDIKKEIENNSNQSIINQYTQNHSGQGDNVMNF
jgi:hypothetical protein